jgi:hypothetical protein
MDDTGPDYTLRHERRVSSPGSTADEKLSDEAVAQHLDGALYNDTTLVPSD